MKYGPCRKMHRAGCKHVKQSKPCSQRQRSHILSYAESRHKIYIEKYMHIYITMTTIEGISRAGDEEERKERKRMTR
jgi:hypothetical protein